MTSWRIVALSGAVVVLSGIGVALRATSGADDLRILLLPGLIMLAVGLAAIIAALVFGNRNRRP